MGEYISVCGVDEAGRGSLVGEVYCAAVILPASLVIPGLNDSKKLTPKKRTTLAQQIKEQALAWSIATASMDEIIEFNILHATLRAMAKAVEGLSLRPERVLVDGNKAPKLAMPVETIIKGDLFVPAISAASILAKVARDKKMVELHAEYPLYGFDRHKGYLTKAHLEALNIYGPCPEHRITFSPICKMIAAK